MASLPLEHHELIRATDIDEVGEVVERQWKRCDLKQVDTGTKLDFRLHGTRLGRLSISALTFGAEIVAESGPANFSAVIIPLAGECVVHTGGADVFARPGGSAVVVSAPEYRRIRWSSDCAALIYMFDDNYLEERLQQLGVDVARPLRFAPRLDASAGPGHRLVTGLLRPLVAAIDHGNRRLANPIAAEQTEEMVITGLLRAQPNNYSAEIRQLWPPS
jgi:hypothetical protein